MSLLLVCLTCSALLFMVAEHVSVLGVAGSLDGLALTLSSGPVSSILRRARGRPRKFAVAFPRSDLDPARECHCDACPVNPDLSRAIVSIAKSMPVNGHPPAELSVFGNRAVITVRPTPSLERRAGVHLVPLPDGRALI